MLSKLREGAPFLALLALFIAALVFRPLLPVDETRYLTVAWEMFLQKQYAVLSLNFQPYHHKPPMLFWLINTVWEILGVSRAAAMVPVFIAACGMMLLTRTLASELGLSETQRKIIPWLLLGSVPFLIYSSMIMFDVMLSCFVLAALIGMCKYAKDGKLLWVICAGFMMGLGILTKGPVALLYILSPLVFYAWWKREDMIRPAKFFIGICVAILIALIPVLCWLVPALTQTNGDFAFWLIWNQTAGRVTGNFSSAHVRPFYFYLAILPVLFLPWAFFPTFWKNLQGATPCLTQRFLISATLPTFIAFSLIAGKQPHYLLPLLPFMVIFMAMQLDKMKSIVLIGTSLIMVILVIVGQGVAAQSFFGSVDLEPVSEFYNTHQNDTEHWGFVRKYQGELGFLARMEKPIESLEFEDLADWFQKYPDGFAVVRHGKDDNIAQYETLFTQSYKGRDVSVIRQYKE